MVTGPIAHGEIPMRKIVAAFAASAVKSQEMLCTLTPGTVPSSGRVGSNHLANTAKLALHARSRLEFVTVNAELSILTRLDVETLIEIARAASFLEVSRNQALIAHVEHQAIVIGRLDRPDLIHIDAFADLAFDQRFGRAAAR